LADQDVYGPAKQIDRGHIVRREDNAWGRNERETEFANSDTFHWTNCTPQHQAFNREEPGSQYGGLKGLWGGFEQYIQQSLLGGDPKASILAGPVLQEDDPSEDFGTGPVQYPVLFWKVVVVAATGEGDAQMLKAYGFLLSQADVVTRFGVEFAPGRFARYQVKLADIQTRAGVTFGKALLDADAKG
jgi:endonuclease G